MNKQLPLIALALLSFVAVFLFLYLEDRDARETRDSESSPFKERTYDPLEGVVTPRRSADAAPQVTMTPDSTLESPAMGTLEIVGRLANGNRPGELEILVDPEGLDFRPTATGFEATDIAPGAYRVTL
ncbi:MAG: hypothetical protein KDB53_02575, partial [Planctomycetes bacterium]|nr:hypothetical protein [Planctomycetota bacterium]